MKCSQEVSLLSAGKLSPTDNITFAVHCARGLGETSVRRLYEAVWFQAAELERLGIPTRTDSLAYDMSELTLQEKLNRLSSFTFKLMSLRFWTFAEREWIYPKRFAAVLGSEGNDPYYACFEQEWKLLALMESLLTTHSGIAIWYNERISVSKQMTQHIFRQLAHFGFRASPRFAITSAVCSRSLATVARLSAPTRTADTSRASRRAASSALRDYIENLLAARRCCTGGSRSWQYPRTPSKTRGRRLRSR